PWETVVRPSLIQLSRGSCVLPATTVAPKPANRTLGRPARAAVADEYANGSTGCASQRRARSKPVTASDAPPVAATCIDSGAWSETSDGNRAVTATLTDSPAPTVTSAGSSMMTPALSAAAARPAVTVVV